MKISHIFAAIELDNLDPARFPKHLVDAWRKVRFASPLKGYAGSDAIGAALIGTDNFAWKSSGWFDESSITFPAALIPRDKDDLLAHFEWMIDCRRNKDTVAHLWKEVQKPLPRRAKGACFVGRKELAGLADAILLLARDEPLLAKALLTGRLWRASALVAKMHEELEAKGHLNTVIHMVLIWALFDLQVIAYRLFHAEWNALDAGMESAENMTLESLHKIARTIAEMGKRAAKLYRKGKGLRHADERLRSFILENDLIKVVRKNAARLNIKPATLGPGAAERQAIELYLGYLQERLGGVVRTFAWRSKRSRTTLTGYAAHAAGVTKGRFAPRPIRSPKARSLESKQSVATARFSLPALTALLYAVENVVDQLGSVPTGGKVSRTSGGQFTGGRPLFKAQQRKQLTAALFTIYRDLFVRSQFNAWNTVSDRNCERFAVEAERAIAMGLPNPGLEPPRGEWRSRPSKPLFPGVPAGVLLADGGGLGSQEPGLWKPKRISAERKAATRAIRSLARNDAARRHFRKRAARVDKDFGGGISHRLHPREDSDSAET